MHRAVPVSCKPGSRTGGASLWMLTRFGYERRARRAPSRPQRSGPGNGRLGMHQQSKHPLDGGQFLHDRGMLGIGLLGLLVLGPMLDGRLHLGGPEVLLGSVAVSDGEAEPTGELEEARTRQAPVLSALVDDQGGQHGPSLLHLAGADVKEGLAERGVSIGSATVIETEVAVRVPELSERLVAERLVLGRAANVRDQAGADDLVDVVQGHAHGNLLQGVSPMWADRGLSPALAP